VVPLTFQRARTEDEEAPTCGGDRRSRALAHLHLHLHLEHEVDLDRVVDIRRTSAAGEMLHADAIEQALPALGRSGALNVLLAAYSLAATLWQIAHRPQRLIDAFAEEPEVPPGWNLDFASALTQLLTATCVGPLSESAEQNPT